MRKAFVAIVLLSCCVLRGATVEQQQIVHRTDHFQFIYEVTLPKENGLTKVWLPVAKSDAFQQVKIESVSLPGCAQIIEDSANGNKVEFISCTNCDVHRKLRVSYLVQRNEKSAYKSAEKDLSRFLQPDRLVPLTARFKQIAQGATQGMDSDLARGRALYDHVLTRMKYDKSGTGWGRGDAVYACDARTGNCTDFHSYFIALARSIGLPARFAIGVSIPADQSGGTVEGYHCWAEFLANGKWFPVDISEASKHRELADYYFGHQPANRFELSVGRDLVVDPAPASGPINFLVYPLVEVDGKPVKVETKFTFHRLP
ncbi:MAG: transglutaminase-like domain-containing protein [Limisphaerales bacterium]